MSQCLNIFCVTSYKPYTTPKIPTSLSMTFIYCTQLPQNSQSALIINIVARNTMVTSDLRPEVIWPFRACAMKMRNITVI